MSWHGIEGHDAIVDQFRRALSRGRLASSFLFVGPEGIGKRAFALRLAQALLCSTHPEAALDPCGRCPSCVQVEARSHPDMILVSKPAEKAEMPVSLFIGYREHRMQEGLCHDLALKPFLAGRKVALIDDADYLNAEGANSLLKTLEEPPPRSVLILIGTTPAKQLPTIRSRCQLVRFGRLPADAVARLLVDRGLVDDDATAQRVAAESGGSLQQAVELADAEVWAFRERLIEVLAAPRLDALALSQFVAAFVDEAGKEAPPRRRRMRMAFRMAVEFYRQMLRAKAGDGGDGAEPLPSRVRMAASRWPGDDETAAALVERCLEAAEHVDRNAHQAAVLDCWANDLSGVLAGEANEPARAV